MTTKFKQLSTKFKQFAPIFLLSSSEASVTASSATTREKSKESKAVNQLFWHTIPVYSIGSGPITANNGGRKGLLC